MLHLGTIVPHNARYRPDHGGVVFEEHRLDWREFDAHVRRVADTLLSLGLHKGDGKSVV